MQRLLKAVPTTGGGTSDQIFDGHFVKCGSSTHAILSRNMSILRHRIFVIRSGQPTVDYRHGDHVLNAVIAPELQENEPASGHETLKQRSRKVEADEIRAMLDSFDGNREEVAPALGINKTTLWRKLSER